MSGSLETSRPASNAAVAKTRAMLLCLRVLAAKAEEQALAWQAAAWQAAASRWADGCWRHC